MIESGTKASIKHKVAINLAKSKVFDTNEVLSSAPDNTSFMLTNSEITNKTRGNREAQNIDYYISEGRGIICTPTIDTSSAEVRSLTGSVKAILPSNRIIALMLLPDQDEEIEISLPISWVPEESLYIGANISVKMGLLQGHKRLIVSSEPATAREPDELDLAIKEAF